MCIRDRTDKFKEQYSDVDFDITIGAVSEACLLYTSELRGDGAEVRITLDTVKWKTDDDVPGQIRFVFETPEQSARVNVRVFLKDGFFVPKPQEERVVDMESHGYQEMICLLYTSRCV